MVHLKQTVLLFEAQLLHPAQHYFLCLGHLFLQANVEMGLLGPSLRHSNFSTL